MSRLLGNPAHQCYVYPDFDNAIEKWPCFDLAGQHEHDRKEVTICRRAYQRQTEETAAILDIPESRGDRH